MKYILLTLIICAMACSSKLSRESTELDIHKAIKNGKDVVIRDKTFYKEIDFTKILTQNPIGRNELNSTCNSSLVFVDCTFTEPVSGFNLDNEGKIHTTTFNGNISFINCLFHKSVNLRSCAVKGKIDLSESIFRMDLIMEDMTIVQPLNMRKTTIDGEGRFQNTRFQNMVNFMEMKVNANISFQAASFYHDANFSVSEMNKYVDFSLARFYGLSVFNYFKAKDRVVFDDALFLLSPQLSSTEISQLSINHVTDEKMIALKNEIEKKSE